MDENHQYNANFDMSFYEVVWVLIFEFLCERVGSRLSNICDCIR